MPTLPITALAPLTEVDGDNDLFECVDVSEATVADKHKKVVGKHVAGGMVAHGDAVKAFYKGYHLSADGIKNYKIAQLAATGISSGTVRLIVMLDLVGDNSCALEIILNNRSVKVERVLSISAENIGLLNDIGIRTYVEADTSLSIYMYYAGTANCALSVLMIHAGYANLSSAIITPPNKTTSITLPTGTLSLDTTAGKYANGVPDGNEGWNTLTITGWTAALARYSRHSNGLAEIQLNFSAVGTTTDGFIIATLPAGYMPGTEISGVLIGNVGVGSAAGELRIDSSGNIKIYDFDSGSTANWRCSFLYKVES